MKRPTAKHQAELRKSYGKVGDRIKLARGVKDTTRRPTESINLGMQLKEHAGADLKLSTHL